MRQYEKYFLSVFKMAEIFENLNNIFCDWAKAKGRIKSCRGSKQVQELRKKKKMFLQQKMIRKKVLEQSAR